MEKVISIALGISMIVIALLYMHLASKIIYRKLLLCRSVKNTIFNRGEKV